jgi:acyl dehydratase
VDEELDRRRDQEEGEITPDRIERLRRRIGLPQPFRDASFEFASVDVLRNYARCICEIDPLYRDADYARATAWGSFAAQPTFLFYMGVSEEVEFSEELLATGRGDPLSGVHAWYGGEDVEWFARIEENDRLKARKELDSVELKQGRMGGEAVHEVYKTSYWNQNGTLVGVRRMRVVRVERSKARSEGKNLGLDVPHRYSVEEMAAIDADYEREYIRGAEPRFWEDVEIGEEIIPLVRGPYTTTSYILFAEGTGPRNDFHRAHSDAYQYRKLHPRAFPLNDLGYPDTIARVHWERDMAIRAGLPESYDFGGERVTWLSIAATHWMGDAGFLRRLKMKLHGFCFVGDTVWIRGSVVAKRIDEGQHVVDIDLAAINHRSESIASGTATIVLPVRGESTALLLN